MGQLIGAAPKSGFPNVTRYFNHIQTFNAEAQAKFPNIEGLSVSDAPVVAAPAKKKSGGLLSDSDSDSDVGGGLLDSDSDDEDDAAARLAAIKAASKAKSGGKKRRPPERSEIILDVKPFDDQTDLEALAAKIQRNFQTLRTKNTLVR